ncbi:WAP four-disulfide core domain protein 1 like protein [Argiope bruennichi]|uniref:WAP four-disulfide core domain protein 1 like protein n=1 Tax=Argiope bruennichi TaxID=94029 RepID=A0A8T0E876_ARGBR|nr:WAP four-disulfide core domain protein 1 like protein [Argiope bruennichi]
MEYGKSLSALAPFMWIIFVVISQNEGKVDEAHPFTNHRVTAEEIKSYLTAIMSQNDSFWSCPAPRLPLLDEDCKLPTCKNNEDCPSKNQSCCFNGCIFTCVESLTPPPVIDWDNEVEAPPLRREGEAVLRCTTSPRPAPSEPLGCPKGYVCKIEDYGDPLERRYNSGICVPDSGAVGEPETESLDGSGLKEKTRKQTVYLPGGCILSEKQYEDMKEFMTRSYVDDCLCIEGSIECKVQP